MCIDEACRDETRVCSVYMSTAAHKQAGKRLPDGPDPAFQAQGGKQPQQERSALMRMEQLAACGHVISLQSVH